MKHSFTCSMLAAAALASSLFLSGCDATPKMNGLFQEPSFTYTSLSSGGLAIGGVTTTGRKPGDPSVTARDSHYAELLQEAVINQRPGITIMPAGDIAQTMGHQYEKMMDYYAYRDVAAEEYLTLIGAKTGHVRYIMFASLPSDTTAQSRSEYDDEVDYNATRTLTASVKIYDLLTHHIVWSGSLTESRTATNPYQRAESVGIITSIVRLAQDDAIDKHGTYPTAPYTTYVATYLFNDVAANLPAPPKKEK